MNNLFALVIFGATGDLAQHKLFPALFSLYKNHQLPQEFVIYGFARRLMNNDEYRVFLQHEILRGIYDKVWVDFSQHIFYQQGVFSDKKGYQELQEHLDALEKQNQQKLLRIFYLATPPQNYDNILDNSVDMKLVTKSSRIAIEKPFGKDLTTAKLLDKKLSEIFEEKQIFRVDHYLGKETLQNLLVFRFANGIFDPIWNSEYVDHVQITWGEKKGIGNRGNFFDGVGILRDVGQNHLMQLIAAVSMEMPRSFSKEGVRDARSQAIGNIACIDPKEVENFVVRGQYEGYKQEENINPDSLTETFVAMKFFVNSKRFAHVPFYVRAGKELAEHVAEISLVFKQTCHILFKEIGCPEDGNILTIRIQPNEGIALRIIAKTPGSHVALQPVDMHFTYDESFGTAGSDAYEKVFIDIILGDQMLFNRSDELESSWKFIENITEGWNLPQSKLYSYPKASMGPSQANLLIEKDGRKWI